MDREQDRERRTVKQRLKEQYENISLERYALLVIMITVLFLLFWGALAYGLWLLLQFLKSFEAHPKLQWIVPGICCVALVSGSVACCLWLLDLWVKPPPGRPASLLNVNEGDDLIPLNEIAPRVPVPREEAPQAPVPQVPAPEQDAPQVPVPQEDAATEAFRGRSETVITYVNP